MSLKEHKKYRAFFLKIGREEVARRDWLAAAAAYQAAAHHEAVVAALTAKNN